MRSERRGWGWYQRGSASLVAALLLAACGGGGSKGQPAEETLRIGALLSLTGGWSTLGQTSQSALNLAAADVNAYLAGLDSHVRVEVEIVDTKLVPDAAVSGLQALARHGVRIVVGPQSSAEVSAVKPIADRQDVLVISQGSTAHALAIAGDNVFRLCPDDAQEGPAIVALMWEQGTRVLIGVSRRDDGNLGLQASAGTAFAALGGTVLGTLQYPGDQSDFAATVADLEARIEAAVAARDVGAVGVYLTAFDEAGALFAAAAARPTLGSVRWYGSDGVVGSPALLAASAAPFALDVGYPCPIFGLDPNAAPLWKPIAQAVANATGLAPDAFGLSTYDAVWLATLAYLQVGGISDLAAYKDAFVRTAETYFGVTGWTRLNDAGDRASGAFDFMAICEAGEGHVWQQVGTYEPTADEPGTVAFSGCAP